MGALQAENIRFQLIGMSAAILQGVEGSTRDIELWIDLPSRQYMRVINLCRTLGAEMVRNTVVFLEDDTMVNFVYEVTGLGSFATEYPKAHKIRFHRLVVPVLPLQSIKRSKSAVCRPKDLIHVEMINRTLRGTRLTGSRRRNAT